MTGSTSTEWRTLRCSDHESPQYSHRFICPSCHYPRAVPVCCMFKTEAHIPEEEQYALASSSWSGARAAPGPDRSSSSSSRRYERIFPPLAAEFRALSLVHHQEPCFSIVPFYVGRKDPSCDSVYAYLDEFHLPAMAMCIMVLREPAPTKGALRAGAGAQLPVWLRTGFLRMRHSMEVESVDGLFRDVQQRLVFRNCNAPDPLDEGLVRLACLDLAATNLLGAIPWEGNAVSAHGVTGIPTWPILYRSTGPFPSISSQTRGQRPARCKVVVNAYISIVGVPRWWLVTQGYARPTSEYSESSLSPLILVYDLSVSFHEPSQPLSRTGH